MRIIFFLLLPFLFNQSIKAQVVRNYFYAEKTIEVLAQNNRMENSFSFPGMKVFIIIGDSSKSLNEIYIADKLRQLPISGMNDYACFYYLNCSYLLKDTSVYNFLKGFIEQCFKWDYIDRNSVHLVSDINTIPCQVFPSMDSIVSSFHILSSNIATPCNTYAASSAEQIWTKSQPTKTTATYSIPGLLEMEEIENAKQRRNIIASFKKNKSNIFFQLTVGRHHIGSQYKTDFDTSTLVDFTKYKTLWNIIAGYYFTNRLSANIDFAFIYSGKQKNIDDIDWGNGSSGITVRGSGYAGAMLRYGVGIGWLLYSKNRLDILLNLSTGQLKAIAGGGDATRTIGGGGVGNSTNIIEKNESTFYYTVSPGINYKLSQVFFLSSNLQYALSKFTEPIGSVKAFTGWSFNIGIGFAISTKTKSNE